MKKILIPMLSFSLLVSLSTTRAQDPASGNYAAVQQVKLPMPQLEELVSPIALYPDPLIALILPASTVPTDVVLADRYIKDGKDPAQVDSQNWDPSVKSLARYPDVLAMMDENLDWTNQLGTAVIAQQEDVMQAVQNQRAKANALGNLSSTPQQQVVVEKQVIQIVPADPQVIYVPQYDPQVIYVERAPEYSPFITFGVGFAMGAWLTNDCDWNHRGFYVNNWGRNGWHGYPRYNTVNINVNQNNYWRPNAYRPPPRPPYVPNRVSATGNQNIPAFRPATQGGFNNRPQNVQNNRPAAVAPANANFQAQPNRMTPMSAVNPSTNARPGAGSPVANTPQNKPAVSSPAAVPDANQNNRSGSGGNNGQWSGGNGKKDHSPGNPAAPVQQPNQSRPSTQQVTTPQASVTPRPQPVTPVIQPATSPSPGPKTSGWKNSQNSQPASQDQQRRAPQQSNFTPQPDQKRQVQQPSGNSQGQGHGQGQQQRPANSPQPQQQQQKSQQPTKNAPQTRNQNAPQGQGNQQQQQQQQGWQRGQ